MSLRVKIPLGQLLVEQKIITPQQLEAALTEQKRTGHMLGVTLIQMGHVSEEMIMLPVLASQLGVEYVQLKNINVPPDVLDKLPAKVANHYKVFPVRFESNMLMVAMAHPLDIHTLDDLSLMVKHKVGSVLASEKEIIDAIRNHYGVGAETIERMMSDVDASAQTTEVNTIDEDGAEASISQFLNQILLQAYKDHATDIHIEPFADELRVRYRIDGVLYDTKVPDNIHFFQDALISRIKILSNLNIAEKRMPQDGRFKVRTSEADLDLRVVTMPSAFGESAVLRLLNSIKLYSFEDLGLVGGERQHLEKLLEKPHGIIFMTGPTGSGKTTTLYTCLASVNKDDIKIMTIEDPVEYQLRGITQVQTNAPIGLTFAAILRSILRSDPDIIMVGEVRDSETAQITIQVALTGHLVFSTLHTNDAASGVTRLLDMGIEPYLIASSVECFIAQRLIRLLCPQCKVPTKISEDVIREFGLKENERQITVYESKGCKECRQTGYLGRQAICEFLIMNDDIRSLIVKRATSGEIKDKAVVGGMKTLRQHGWEKIASGITAPSEVLRATKEDQ